MVNSFAVLSQAEETNEKIQYFLLLSVATIVFDSFVISVLFANGRSDCTNHTNRPAEKEDRITPAGKSLCI